MKKSMLKVVMCGVALSMLGLSIPAFADVTQEDINRFVKMYDSNKDGMVSKAELMKRASEMFDKMDTGKKGMMDDKKAMAFLLELQKSDGAVGHMMSKADIMKKIEAAFDKLDAAKKGMIDAKQVANLLNELMKSGG